VVAQRSSYACSSRGSPTPHQPPSTPPSRITATACVAARWPHRARCASAPPTAPLV
jgi:hypothetical protein